MRELRVAQRSPAKLTGGVFAGETKTRFIRHRGLGHFTSQPIARANGVPTTQGRFSPTKTFTVGTALVCFARWVGRTRARPTSVLAARASSPPGTQGHAKNLKCRLLGAASLRARPVRTLRPPPPPPKPQSHVAPPPLAAMGCAAMGCAAISQYGDWASNYRRCCCCPRRCIHGTAQCTVGRQSIIYWAQNPGVIEEIPPPHRAWRPAVLERSYEYNRASLPSHEGRRPAALRTRPSSGRPGLQGFASSRAWSGRSDSSVMCAPVSTS